MGFTPAGPDNKAIRETRDATSSLLASSRRLECLTKVLIVVTAILAVLTLVLALRGF